MEPTCSSAGAYDRLCGLGLTVAVLDSSKGINKGSSGSKMVFSLFLGIVISYYWSFTQIQ